jgi:hypothetical protein
MKTETPEISLLEGDQLMLLGQLQNVVAQALAVVAEKEKALLPQFLSQSKTNALGGLLKKTNRLCLDLIHANCKRLNLEGKIKMPLPDFANLKEAEGTLQ